MLLKYYLIKNMNLFYINNIIFRKNNIKILFYNNLERNLHLLIKFKTYLCKNI